MAIQTTIESHSPITLTGDGCLADWAFFNGYEVWLRIPSAPQYCGEWSNDYYLRILTTPYAERDEERGMSSDCPFYLDIEAGKMVSREYVGWDDDLGEDGLPVYGEPIEVEFKLTLKKRGEATGE